MQEFVYNAFLENRQSRTQDGPSKTDTKSRNANKTNSNPKDIRRSLEKLN